MDGDVLAVRTGRFAQERTVSAGVTTGDLIERGGGFLPLAVSIGARLRTAGDVALAEKELWGIRANDVGENSLVVGRDNASTLRNVSVGQARDGIDALAFPNHEVAAGCCVSVEEPDTCVIGGGGRAGTAGDKSCRVNDVIGAGRLRNRRLKELTDSGTHAVCGGISFIGDEGVG